MLESLPDAASLSMVLAGAFVAGFVTGFAGFGTGLVSSGLWFHALPAPMVPPLVALASVAAQIVGLATVRKAFEWRRAMPYLIGGLAGVPLGVAALKFATPGILRLTVGGFLVAYAAFQLLGAGRLRIGAWGGRASDGAVGAGGGFAGLSGPQPLVWLQMRGGTSAEQRATYQPFNLIVLVAASVGMSVSGAIDGGVLTVAALCLPVTVLGAWIGARFYTGVSEQAFRRIVLVLLLISGLILVAQGVP
jgi:uncharacterized membrane protein YfcA